MIKKIVLYASLIFGLNEVHVCAAGQNQKKIERKDSFEITVQEKKRQYQALECLMLKIGERDELEKLCKMIKFDLEFTDQLKIDLKHAREIPSDRVLNKLSKEGVALFFSAQLHQNGAGQEVEIQVKDPSSGMAVFEKRYPFTENDLIYQGHAIADDLMPVLCGEKGPHMSSLAYCKQIAPSRKVLCVSDYAGCKEKVVIDGRTINVAPRWHTKAPCLFFSQFTRHNSRLMSIDLKTKQQKIVCSYDGLNMQPSFSDDGIKVVLCFSSKGNSELYLYDQVICSKLKRRVFKKLTNNNGNNVSPCLLPSGDVVFCSDFEFGRPQVYLLDGKTLETRRLTNGKGYCAAPSFCSKTNDIVYTRYARGVFQLFSLNLGQANPVEKQLTFNEGDKLEPVWSECGKYIAFTYNCGEKKTTHFVRQIAIFNLASQKFHVITSGNEPKSYPTWVNSPLYHLA